MQRLFEIVGSRAADLPLRPLLCAAGVAATAAGVYYYMKKRGDGDGETRTPVTNVPVQVHAIESVLDLATNLPKNHVTELLQDQSMGLLLKGVDMDVPQDQAIKLPEVHFTEVSQDQATKSPEVHFTEVPQDLATKSPEVLCTEVPQDQATKSPLVQSMETLQDQSMECPESPHTAHPCACCSFLEADEKHLKLAASNDQLEDRVRLLEGLLREAHRVRAAKATECDQQKQSHEVLQSKFNDLNDSLLQNEECLKVSLAEAEHRHEKALDSITQLEKEKSGLMHQVTTLRASVQEMGELLLQSHRECDELAMECEQKQKTHSDLLVAFEEMKKELTHREELLKVSLAEAEQQNQKSLDSISQLEKDKSGLMHQVTALRASVQEMGELLVQSHRECDELAMECEQRQQAHAISSVNK